MIHSLIKKWWALKLGPSEADEYMDKSTGFVGVQLRDCFGLRIGYCWMQRLEDPSVFRLSDLIVQKDWRSRGVGRLLLGKALAYAKFQGAKRVVGSVVPNDFRQAPWIMGWYERLGFSICPPTPADLPHAVARIERAV